MESPTTTQEPAAVRRLRLSAILEELDARNQALTMGEIIDATAHAGFGFVVAFLALAAIPFVGLSTPFGLAVSAIGAQILFGRERPWLPRWLRARPVSAAALERITRFLTRATRWLERLVRPRWLALTRGGGFVAIGLALVVQGLGLALPLPIPGSNWIFLVPVLVYAIGVLEDDGIVIAVAHLATVIDLALLIALWRVVHGAVVHAISWLGL